MDNGTSARYSKYNVEVVSYGEAPRPRACSHAWTDTACTLTVLALPCAVPLLGIWEADVHKLSGIRRNLTSDSYTNLLNLGC